jgi:hypothetical protein
MVDKEIKLKCLELAMLYHTNLFSDDIKNKALDYYKFVSDNIDSHTIAKI